MRRLLAAASIAVIAAAAGRAAAGTAPQRIAFGGTGSLGTYTVTIEPDGAVHAAGAGSRARTGVSQLNRVELAALERAAVHAGFASLPARTRCRGAGPRSATWILIGARKVTVVGKCLPVYQRLFRSLVAATQLIGAS